MKSFLFSSLLVFSIAPSVQSQTNRAVDDSLPARIVEREQEVAGSLRKFHPIVETYIQVMSSKQGELVPWYDQHFVSLADFSGQLRALRFKPRQSEVWRDIKEYSDSFSPRTLQYDPSGFVAMAYPDPSTFDLQHYRFQYLTTEFVGEIRCLVFQVSPTATRKSGLFEGKIWVEDRNLTIIRFNGSFMGTNIDRKYSHFDSRRTNAGAGLWVPATIYSEEDGLPCCGLWKLNWTKIRFKSQTRFWGYDLHNPDSSEALTSIAFESASPVRDLSAPANSWGPIEQRRHWAAEAENNLTAQLEHIGLLSPAGEVEHELETIVNNLEATNNLSIEPEVRCRVLLTSNLESAVVGHTIILSRGLLDVLPDETVLAAVLAHNLAHVAAGDSEAEIFAWADQVKFDSRDVSRKLQFVYSARQEAQASSRAQEWILHSPYNETLDSIARFQAELRSSAPHIKQLLDPTIGESLYASLSTDQLRSGGSVTNNVAEVRPVQLGSRVRINPWNDEIELLQTTKADLLSQREAVASQLAPF